MTGIRPLSWGRRYLMCRPEHFRVEYAINPWMDVDSAVDPDRALAQWDALVGDSLLVAAGPRTDVGTHAVLSRKLGVRVATIPILHPALYHLDLSF